MEGRRSMTKYQRTFHILTKVNNIFVLNTKNKLKQQLSKINTCKCCFLFLMFCILSPLFYFLMAREYIETAKVVLHSQTFGLYRCDLMAVLSHNNRNNESANTCASRFHSQVAEANALIISPENPISSFDEYLHFGPPVFIFPKTNKRAIHQLISLLEKKQHLFENILFYNVNLPTVHRIVKQLQFGNFPFTLYKEDKSKQNNIQVSVIYTKQQDFHFTKKQHIINRKLRLSNVISIFASTTVYNEENMHTKNDYFDTISFLIRTRPRQHGLIRRVLDDKIHIGIFDVNAPLQSIQNEIWAACTNGDEYIVHAYMVEGTKRILRTFDEMCDNPIRWHKYLGQTRDTLDSLILQMDIHIATSSYPDAYSMNLISTRLPVVSKQSANLYKYSSKLNDLLTYDETSTSYDIQKVIDMIVKYPSNKFQFEIGKLIRDNNYHAASKFNNLFHTESSYNTFFKNPFCNSLPLGHLNNFINGVSYVTRVRN
jgi:hypothetical protein